MSQSAELLGGFLGFFLQNTGGRDQTRSDFDYSRSVGRAEKTTGSSAAFFILWASHCYKTSSTVLEKERSACCLTPANWEKKKKKDLFLKTKLKSLRRFGTH